MDEQQGTAVGCASDNGALMSEHSPPLPSLVRVAAAAALLITVSSGMIATDGDETTSSLLKFTALQTYSIDELMKPRLMRRSHFQRSSNAPQLRWCCESSSSSS
ncbi:hypothetical protein FHG87_015963 [Trinorchestia longiramus]|nr:hypothetical protein FHG87_015963 [Trinorchestia longiramus]